MENNEIIKLESLPVIKYQLEQLSVEIKEKTDNALKLVCSEDTVKEVKQVRSSLTKEFNELESQRKAVKQAIMNKYDEFEEIYKENVSNLYKQADSQLKEKIDNVENGLKEEKRNEIYDFAMEYIAANDIQDYVKFEDIGLNITLSASMKSLKEMVIAYCEQVKKTIELIKLDEYRDEILVEYKILKDYPSAKIAVIERHKALDKLRGEQEKQEIKEEQDKQVEEVIEEITAPVEVENDEEEDITVTFTVTGSRTKLKELKNWLKENNLSYE